MDGLAAAYAACADDVKLFDRDRWLADLLLVDGDPTADVTILQDKANLVAIMKDGKFHKAPIAKFMEAA